jgi:hypothetical protein
MRAARAVSKAGAMLRPPISTAFNSVLKSGLLIGTIFARLRQHRHVKHDPLVHVRGFSNLIANRFRIWVANTQLKRY